MKRWNRWAPAASTAGLTLLLSKISRTRRLVGRLSDSISVYIGPSPRKRGKEENWQMREKMFKQPPHAPTASIVGPCPTIFQTSKKPRHWKFTQHHRATRPTQGRPGAESYTVPSLSPTDHSKRTKVKWLLLGGRITLKDSNNLSFLVL